MHGKLKCNYKLKPQEIRLHVHYYYNTICEKIGNNNSSCFGCWENGIHSLLLGKQNAPGTVCTKQEGG